MLRTLGLATSCPRVGGGREHELPMRARRSPGPGNRDSQEESYMLASPCSRLARDAQALPGKWLYPEKPPEVMGFTDLLTKNARRDRHGQGCARSRHTQDTPLCVFLPSSRGRDPQSKQIMKLRYDQKGHTIITFWKI